MACSTIVGTYTSQVRSAELPTRSYASCRHRPPTALPTTFPHPSFHQLPPPDLPLNTLPPQYRYCLRTLVLIPRGRARMSGHATPSFFAAADCATGGPLCHLYLVLDMVTVLDYRRNHKSIFSDYICPCTSNKPLFNVRSGQADRSLHRSSQTRYDASSPDSAPPAPPWDP